MRGATTLALPLPGLCVQAPAGLKVLTDPDLARACGVRIAFTFRRGGASEGPYASLNLASHVGDEEQAVAQNRRTLLASLGAEDVELVVPSQVHGTDLVSVLDAASLGDARAAAREGADGIVVAVPDVAALLCFADCAPVIVASPTGAFAVAHAGWRGAVAGIASKAAWQVAQASAGPDADSDQVRAIIGQCNAYIGPCIRSECFEVGPEVRERFVERFGASCAPDGSHVDLPAAIKADLTRCGVDPERIADAGLCTACEPDELFSYRASQGTCGRHGALAFRQERW